MKATSARKFSVFTVLDAAIILGISAFPLLLSYSYRINIFLSWEGAYRMSQGQIPYRDFGLPLGYGYWIIPGIFFKLFGPQMFTLIKAQFFINSVGGFAFRKILKNLGVEGLVLTLSIWVFCISYSFFNFWPWYNHTVIIYQLVGLAFLTTAFFTVKTVWSNVYVVVAAFFLFLSFFTKQDAGALGILIAGAISLVYAIVNKTFRHLVWLVGAVVIWGLIFILPLNGSFSYWFNHGQPPHNSRVSPGDILNDFFDRSQFIKFYLIGVVVIAFHRLSQRSVIRPQEVVFFFLVLGILAEAVIFQVTSYVPGDNNIFFHSFAFAFFAWYLYNNGALPVYKPLFLVIFALLVVVFWSERYWMYIRNYLPASESKGMVIRKSATGENIVDKSNYVLDIKKERESEIPTSEWAFSNLPSFAKIRMPKSTIEGINRLREMPEFKAQKRPRVLNMTELTPLAHDLNFALEKGPGYPLWFHLGVGMFNKQLKMFDERVQKNYYDVVLFEHIDFLNNFYPFELRDELQKNYKKVDTFLAPRNPIGGDIEVYIRK